MRLIGQFYFFSHDKISQAQKSTKITKSIKTQPSKSTKIKNALKKI